MPEYKARPSGRRGGALAAKEQAEAEARKAQDEAGKKMQAEQHYHYHTRTHTRTLKCHTRTGADYRERNALFVAFIDAIH